MILYHFSEIYIVFYDVTNVKYFEISDGLVIQT